MRMIYFFICITALPLVNCHNPETNINRSKSESSSQEISVIEGDEIEVNDFTLNEVKVEGTITEFVERSIKRRNSSSHLIDITIANVAGVQIDPLRIEACITNCSRKAPMTVIEVEILVGANVRVNGYLHYKKRSDKYWLSATHIQQPNPEPPVPDLTPSPKPEPTTDPEPTPTPQVGCRSNSVPSALGSIELPREFLHFPYTPPTRGTIWTVRSGDNFQTVLNSVKPGDIIEMEAGATFSGNFTVRNQAETGWIYIRTTDYDNLPPEGTRVGPSNSASMPKIISPNSTPALTFEFGASRYRLVGLEVTTTIAATNVVNYDLIRLGFYSGRYAESDDELSTQIVFDRMYIHGTPTGNVKRGIALNSAYSAVIDSYISDIHGWGIETQAIGAWNGPGPFKVVNNYLEAAGENIMFGGATPRISGLIPSDIEVRNNHMFKPLSWMTTHPTYAGTPWTVKNVLELKNARRVLIENNVMEHSWAGAQHGFAFVLTPRGQGSADWSTVEDVTIMNNIVRRVGGGVHMLSEDYNGPSQVMNDVRIENNVFYDVNDNFVGYGSMLLMGGCSDCGRPIHNVSVRKNTFLHRGYAKGFLTLAGIAADSLVVEDNIIEDGNYPISCTGKAPGAPSLDACLVPNYSFKSNVMIEPRTNWWSILPVENHIVASVDEVGFVDYNNDEFALSNASSFVNAASDGGALGADITRVTEATSCVIP